MDPDCKLAAFVSLASFGACFWLNNQANNSNATADAISSIPEVTIREAVARAILSGKGSSGPVILRASTWAAGEEYLPSASDGSFVIACRQRHTRTESVPVISKVRARPIATDFDLSDDFSSWASSDSHTLASDHRRSGLSGNISVTTSPSTFTSTPSTPPTFTYIVKYKTHSTEELTPPSGQFTLVDASSFSGTGVVPYPPDVMRGESRRHMMFNDFNPTDSVRPYLTSTNQTTLWSKSQLSTAPVELQMGVQAVKLPLSLIPESAWTTDKVESRFVNRNLTPPASVEVSTEEAALAFPTVPVAEEYATEVLRPKVPLTIIGEVRIPPGMDSAVDMDQVRKCREGMGRLAMVVPGAMMSMTPIKDSASKILRSEIIVGEYGEGPAEIRRKYQEASWSKYVRFFKKKTKCYALCISLFALCLTFFHLYTYIYTYCPHR